MCDFHSPLLLLGRAAAEPDGGAETRREPSRAEAKESGREEERNENEEKNENGEDESVE